MYQTGSKRRVCRRVRRETAATPKATSGAGQHAGYARFGEQHLKGHDAQAGHRDGGGHARRTTWTSSISAWLRAQPVHRDRRGRNVDHLLGRPGACTRIYVVSMDDEIGGGDEVSEDDVLTASRTARGNAAQVRTHRIGAGARGRAPQRASWGHDVRLDYRDGRECSEDGLDIENRATGAGAPRST
jgi:hypothetical protein